LCCLFIFLSLELINLLLMKRRNFILLFALMCFAGKSFAQNYPCGTDEMRKRMIALHPELIQMEESYEKQIAEAIKNINFKGAKKTTFTDQSGNTNFWYDIPIVVHFVHDYGTEYLPDDSVFSYLTEWNKVYAHQNFDTAYIIPPFIKYEGNPHIRLHLATKDPNGNPTKGITRQRSYLTYGGSEQAKFSDWPPTSYLNIWLVYNIGTIVSGAVTLAYAHLPGDVSSDPYYDGVICISSAAANTNGSGNFPEKTINHEIGHCLNLKHPWGNSNNPGVACGDDEVDDTPPTIGHFSTGCAYNHTALYDTSCTRNYYKIYPDAFGGDSLVNYPDTVNAQNIMDYTACSQMFTKGQVARMHAALNSDVAGRNNLWNPTNLYFTGVLSDTVSGTFAPMQDLKPIPEFAVGSMPIPTNYSKNMTYFTFPDVAITFRNETWNDTLSSLVWNFSNSAQYPTYSSVTHPNAISTFTNKFSDPGWVDVKMTATGNHTSEPGVAWDTTVDWPRTIFVADAAGTPASNYYQNFNGADTAKWPTFNYYNNDFKWQMANVGFDDNSSMQYIGFDRRINIFGGRPTVGTPLGDFDDLFSIPMDLSSFTGPSCSINYFYSGASRSSSTREINDTLQISYSINKSQTWTVLASLTQSNLENKGAIADYFVPTSQNDWRQMSIDVPAAARTSYTTFRFRYKPSVGQKFNGSTVEWPGDLSSGNNFYMDKVFFTSFPAGVSTVKLDNMDVVIAPNPTNGDAYVVIKDAANSIAKIVVTDITGKLVYTTSQELTSAEAYIQIPHSAIAVSGMYLVQTSTGNQVHTQKLVVQ
jgi:hypothetical protein